ncbi:MAG: FtsQ-type POTRA domain-containing protein [Proteobacteria bacterium]|nr:FtsQ-type POTRA domain-containing protein [Pseudomonadota bacterium]
MPRKSWRRITVAAGLAVLAGGGIAAAAGGLPGRAVSLTGEMFATASARAGLVVREVAVEGRTNASADELLAALGISRGDSILGFDPARARARLEAIGWIAAAEVRKELPGRIRVSLRERRPFAIWQRDGALSVIDREGEILAVENVGRFDQLLMVVGPDAAANAGALIDALAARPSLLAQVRAAVRVGERRWDVHFQSGVVARLPADAAAAWERLARLDEEYAILARDVEMLDFRLADRLFVRLRPESAAMFGLPVEDA